MSIEKTLHARAHCATGKSREEEIDAGSPPWERDKSGLPNVSGQKRRRDQTNQHLLGEWMEHIAKRTGVVFSLHILECTAVVSSAVDH